MPQEDGFRPDTSADPTASGAAPGGMAPVPPHAASHEASEVPWWRRFVPVLVITLVVGVVGSLFVFSYSAALGQPKPRDVPMGVVTSQFATTGVADALQKASGTTFRVEVFDSTPAALAALDRQTIYGAVTFTAPTTATLYTSQASSAEVATVLSDAVPRLSKTLNAQITVVDEHPLHKNDPSGLILFYVSLATIILGFVGAMQVRVNAAGLNLRDELIADVFRVVVVSLFFSVTVLLIAHFETTPFFVLWGLLSLAMFVSSETLSLSRLVFGPRWGLLPAWLIFVVVANPSSGGAVAPQLLPPFYEAVGRYLPTGALVQAIRDITYFPEAVHAEPYVVLAIWLVAATGLVIALRAFRAQRAGRSALAEHHLPEHAHRAEEGSERA